MFDGQTRSRGLASKSERMWTRVIARPSRVFGCRFAGPENATFPNAKMITATKARGIPREARYLRAPKIYGRAVDFSSRPACALQINARAARENIACWSRNKVKLRRGLSTALGRCFHSVLTLISDHDGTTISPGNSSFFGKLCFFRALWHLFLCFPCRQILEDSRIILRCNL